MKTDCVFCHKEMICTDKEHIFPRHENDGFGRTYGEESKEVSVETAKKLSDYITELIGEIIQ